MLNAELTEFAIAFSGELSDSLQKTAALEFQLKALSDHLDDLVKKVQSSTEASINSYLSLKRQMSGGEPETRPDPFLHKPRFAQIHKELD